MICGHPEVDAGKWRWMIRELDAANESFYVVSNAKKRLNSHLTVPLDKYYLSYLRGFLGAFFCVLERHNATKRM